VPTHPLFGYRAGNSETAQKEFFENGASAREQKAPPNHAAEQERVTLLEMAELMAEHVAQSQFGIATRGWTPPGSWGDVSEDTPETVSSRAAHN
jgi:hypothetical protein